MMGWLPHNWETWPLADVGDWSGGGTPSSTEVAYWDGDIPWVTPKDMKTRRIGSSQDKITIAGIENSAAKMITAGSVLFVTRSGILAHSFPVATTNVPVTINQDLKSITPCDVIDTEYLAWALSALERTILKSCSKHGTTVNSIEMPALKLLGIPVPPLNEQRRIVAKIEELFSELDKGVESLTTAREQLKAYRQAFLEQTFQSICGRTRLDEISDALGGFAFKSESFLKEGKYQVLRMGNIRPGEIRARESPVFVKDVDPKILTRYLLKQGDVLITLTGTRNKRDYGYTAVVNADHYLVNQRIGYLRFKPNYLPKLFQYYSRTRAFQDQFFGFETGNVGQGNVGIGAIRSTVVPFADIVSQEKFVSQLDAVMSAIDRVELDIGQQLLKAAALRQTILKRAFSGQLVAQDPTDEPASILLERIRADNEGGGIARRRNNKKEAA